MIGIRVDANETIATGHAMRCLAIAVGLRKKNIPCIFLVADEISEAFLSSHGFSILCLHTAWNKLDMETQKLSHLLREKCIDTLLIDTYFVTETYLNTLNRLCHILYIDDLNLFRYPVSGVLNYVLLAERIPYYEIYAETKTQLLLGPAYAPLRSQFTSITPFCREKVQRILITMGGADACNVTGHLLNHIYHNSLFMGIEFHIILGKLNKNSKAIDLLSKQRSTFIIHKDVTDMAELMTSCDLAVSAAGVTLYELSACGIPTITVLTADNQQSNINAFADAGLMESAGDFRLDDELCIQKIVDSLNHYISDYDARLTKSKRLHETVDGHGVERIVEALYSYSAEANDKQC